MNNTALIMAGGSSERMRSGGCRTHKALRTIGGTSLLEWNLKQVFFCGFRDVWIAVNEAEEELLSAIAGLQDLAGGYGGSIRTVRESTPLGTIGAARLMIERTDDLLVINVDNITDLDLRAMFDFHLESKAALTVASHHELFRIPFGQLETAGTRVTACVEKPALPILISSGSYALGRRAMSTIAPNTRTQAPDLVNALIGAGELVASYEHSAWWIDVNDEAALARAEAARAEKMINQKVITAAVA